MKKYVQITNPGVTRVVTAGLQYIDTTNVKSPRADRLSVQPAWTKMSVTIKQGSFYYPGEVAGWDSVKALVKDRILTVGGGVDELTDPAEKAEVDAMQKKLDAAKKKYEADIAKNEKIQAMVEETTGQN